MRPIVMLRIVWGDVLALFGSLKLHMAHPESLNQVIDVMSAHFDSQQVLTSGCGLLAKLAVFGMFGVSWPYIKY